MDTQQARLFSGGHKGAEAEFGRAKLDLWERGVPFFQGHRHSHFANAHCDFLEAAAEWGVVGIAACAWALREIAASLATT